MAAIQVACGGPWTGTVVLGALAVVGLGQSPHRLDESCKRGK